MAKPRGTRPGASDQDICQRAGTLSGVVVIAARFMPATVTGRGGARTAISRRGVRGARGPRPAGHQPGRYASVAC